jgi:hypothetical protein
VELTPHREYLLPTQFFEGAETLGHAEVTDAVIDDGLALVRRLWDAGLAHRDIAGRTCSSSAGGCAGHRRVGAGDPSLPVAAGRRPGKHDAVLALRSDPDRVYERALASFSPEEIGEAFAAAQGWRSPPSPAAPETGRTGSHRSLRALAPPHARISIQRWSASRVLLTAAVAVGLVVAGVLAFVTYFSVLD